MRREKSSTGADAPAGAGGEDISTAEDVGTEPYAGPLQDERAAPSVSRAQSLQSRVGNLLATGSTIALGAGLLIWYYAHAYSRTQGPQDTPHIVKTADGDAPLPSLGAMSPPRWMEQTEVMRNEAQETRDPRPVEAGGGLGEGAAAAVLPPLPEAAVPAMGAAGDGAYPVPADPVKSPAQQALERRLSGTVFMHSAQDLARQPVVPVAEEVDAGAKPEETGPREAGPSGGMGALLSSQETLAVRAKVLPARRLLLPRGAFIDCTLETAIDSTLPGMTTCITATDTFGMDGSVVLLERGTKLVGEARGQVQQGAARVFVLWTEARTPTGVIVPLDSPGTDELGRSGLPGKVNRHFWDRFGAAILISTIDGAIQGAVQSQGNGGGAVVYNPSTSQDIMTEVLKSTVNIPPTVVKHNGDRIQVLVARDLDFRPVYELRVHESAN